MFVPSEKYGEAGIPGQDGPAASKLTILAVWPQRPSPSVPDHLPDPIAAKMLEAELCYVAGAPSGACALYRATMERALRDMFPDDTGWLNARIRKAEAERRLPQAMIDWLGEVKAFGDDAAHGDLDATQDDAEAARDFMSLFLTYAYTLPERVRLARAKRAAAKAG